MKRLVLGMALVVLAAPSAANAGVSHTEEQLVRAISQVRQSHGLSPVRGARALHRSAGRYSRWQLSNGYFGHLPQIRMSSGYHLRGEVLRINYGRGVQAGRTVGMWMRSPAHRVAILHPGMRVAGAGVATGSFQGRRATIVTVHLGAR